MTGVLAGPALLFCPGNRPDRFEKAADRADIVILDLEDAVGPAAKESARLAVAAALPALGENVVVRLNATETPWHRDDVEAVRQAGGTWVMLPKVGAPEQLRPLADLSVIALCESAAGVLAAAAIAAEPNCTALFWGGEDLIADLGGHSSRDPAGQYYPVAQHARSTILLAAAAARIPAIDAVYLDINDSDGLRRETQDSVAVGFAAKACIHPGQVAIVRAVFRPSGAEIDWARGVLEAADTHGGGVFAYQGRMVDGPLIAQARQIISRHTA